MDGMETSVAKDDAMRLGIRTMITSFYSRCGWRKTVQLVRDARCAPRAQAQASQLRDDTAHI